jgi:hypothetical protein
MAIDLLLRQLRDQRGRTKRIGRLAVSPICLHPCFTEKCPRILKLQSARAPRPAVAVGVKSHLMPRCEPNHHHLNRKLRMGRKSALRTDHRQEYAWFIHHSLLHPACSLRLRILGSVRLYGTILSMRFLHSIPCLKARFEQIPENTCPVPRIATRPCCRSFRRRRAWMRVLCHNYQQHSMPSVR